MATSLRTGVRDRKLNDSVRAVYWAFSARERKPVRDRRPSDKRKSR